MTLIFGEPTERKFQMRKMTDYVQLAFPEVKKLPQESTMSIEN